MLHFISCDLLTCSADYIAHQVNCRGVMGAGLAKQIRQACPGVYSRYMKYCKEYEPEQLLGKCFCYNNIISIFGQLNYGFDKKVYTDYNALQRAFTRIHNHLPIDDSIAFPFGFGCGLANGDWNIVVKLIEDCFPNRTIFICKK